MKKRNLSSRIILARQQNGLSQKELAEKMEVSQATVSNLETGRQEPTENQITKLRSILGGDLFSSQQRPDSSEGSSIAAAWLSKARQQAGLTQQELANKAGVSQVTISLIETGKAANPRPRTIKLLERAVGVPFENQAKRQLREASEVKGLGTLEDFNPHVPEEYPDESGVYVFYDISDRPIYIGMAVNIAGRIREHADKFWFKRPIVEHASYIKVSDSTLRKQIETTLIKFLKSNAVINKQQVDR